MNRRFALRTAGSSLLGVIALVLPGATTASASSFYYFGNATTNLTWPACPSSGCGIEVDDPLRAITQSSARTVNGNTVCTYSFEADSSFTAVVCSGDLATKPFCGCINRHGASRGTFDGPRPYGRAQVLY